MLVFFDKAGLDMGRDEYVCMPPIQSSSARNPLCCFTTTLLTKDH